MSKPIYMLVMAKGYTEAGYQLSEEERSTLWAKVMDADKRAGGNMLTACNSRWADEEIYDWAVIDGLLSVRSRSGPTPDHPSMKDTTRLRPAGKTGSMFREHA